MATTGAWLRPMRTSPAAPVSRSACNTTLQKTLFGPTSRTDGTENLVGALRTAMGMCGAHTIREFQKAEMVIAPAIKTEGKIYQFAQADS